MVIDRKSTKRKRSPNYSPDEKLLLINICNKYKHIIENKKTDTVSWKHKEDAWLKISLDFNANSTIHRDMESQKMF